MKKINEISYFFTMIEHEDHFALGDELLRSRSTAPNQNENGMKLMQNVANQIEKTRICKLLHNDVIYRKKCFEPLWNSDCALRSTFVCDHDNSSICVKLNQNLSIPYSL